MIKIKYEGKTDRELVRKDSMKKSDIEKRLDETMLEFFRKRKGMFSYYDVEKIVNQARQEERERALDELDGWAEEHIVENIIEPRQQIKEMR